MCTFAGTAESLTPLATSVRYQFKTDSPFLPEYFGPYLGEYVNVLAALEKLNVAILKAMDKTKEVGDDVSVVSHLNLALPLCASARSDIELQAPCR